MKILYVNWAPLWHGARTGGGVNLYSQSMAVNLAGRGHEVSSISSGYAYDGKKRTYIKSCPDFHGVRNFEVYNAPNIAPGFFNFENPLQDICEPVIEELFDTFLKKTRPGVVHFHNIEGFSANCIDIAKKNGARVIFSLHNYHPVCNQIYLLHNDTKICTDFNNGEKCIDCISPPGYRKEIIKRKLAYHITRLPWGGRIWSRGESVTRLGLFRRLSEFIKKHYPSERGNAQSRDRYARRRRGIIRALNRADMIHAVSGFVKDYYVSQGVNSDLVKVCHIGNKMGEKKAPARTEGNSSSPLNFVFLGLSSRPKGLPFLIETLSAMDDRILGSINLHLHARGVNDLEASLRPLSQRLNSLKAFNGYDFNALPEILSGMNYGIVPPLWYDNAPQVVFEMMAMKVPVIGARIGGIPDFVRHMKNGLLFRAGDCDDLAENIEQAVLDRSLEKTLRDRIPSMKTPDQHADELEKYYKEM